jgi:diguanylate cyclase (GGDEF)-like protein
VSLEVTDPSEQLPPQQEPASHLDSYAADLSRTHRELRRHLHHMTVLHEVNTRIASALDPDEVLTSMLDSLGQLLSYETAAVYLVDLEMSMPTENGGLRSVVPATSAARLRAGRACDGSPLDRVNGSSAREDSAVIESMRELRTVERVKAARMLEVAVPLQAGGRAIGALDVQRAEALSEENVKVVELLAASVAVALQNAHLYQETQRLATTDPLTGVSNYRHFHELLNLEVQRARRIAYPVGLIIMDLDHFKLVNDRHGHPVGDVALRQVSEVLRSRLRRTDIVGRLGGEEFGAVLPGANRREVGIVAEKIRRAVEELPPLRGGMTAETTQVTLSLGGMSLDADTADAELLVSYADQALYQAKRKGRNQVCLWQA